MKTAAQRRFAMVGGLFGAIYLILNNQLPSFPEFLLGLLPEENWRKLRKWKHRGE